MFQTIDNLKGAQTFCRQPGAGRDTHAIFAELVVDITDECDMRHAQFAVLVYARDMSRKVLLMLKSVDSLESLQGQTKSFNLSIYGRGISALKPFCDWARGRGIEPDRLCELVMEYAPS